MGVVCVNCLFLLWPRFPQVKLINPSTGYLHFAIPSSSRTRQDGWGSIPSTSEYRNNNARLVLNDSLSRCDELISLRTSFMFFFFLIIFLFHRGEGGQRQECDCKKNVLTKGNCDYSHDDIKDCNYPQGCHCAIVFLEFGHTSLALLIPPL